MQRLAVEFQLFQQRTMFLAGPPVDGVADQRMTDLGHMDANLVSPAGLQAAFDQRRFP